MATTIQQIELPKKARAVDTSGNNNHGQIYSGRGLEFDGVSDNLTTGSDIEGVNKFSDGTAWTVTCWVYFTGEASAFYIGDEAATYSMLIKESTEELRFREVTGGAFHEFNENNTINLNTWYRQTVVCNGTTITCHLNGEIWGSAITPSSTLMYFTGIGNPYESGGARLHALSGMMSDFQVWDSAWSTADVTYDYLNPESLALNNSGTALTESNLKLWYPMQDGHRGQQSYILDGSNTGAVSEKIVDGSFANDLDDWSKYGHRGQQSYILDGANTGLGVELVTNGDFPTSTTAWTEVGTVSYSGGEAVLTGDGTKPTQLIQTITGLSVGSYYRIKFDYNNVSSDSIRVNMDGTVRMVTSSISTGEYEAVFVSTATSQALRFYAYTDLGEISKLSNISVKAINDKHHATTVFYGDELWDIADNNVSDWVATAATSVASSEVAIGGTTDGVKLIYGSQSSNHGSYAQLKASKFLSEDLTVGRKYTVSGLFATDVVGNTNAPGVAVYASGFNYPTGFASANANIIPATNLITNGTMEADSNWATYNSANVNARSDTQAHNGTYSRKFTTDSASEGIQSDTFTSVTGTTYLVSFWVYPDDGTIVRSAIRNGGTGAWVKDVSTTGLTENAWNKVEYQYTEDNGGANAYVIIHSNTQTSGDFYVDDVVVTAFLEREITFTATTTTGDYLAALNIPSTAANDLISQVDNVNSILDGTPDWQAHAAADGTASVSYDATEDEVTFETSTNTATEGMKLTYGNYSSLEIGRTYTVKINMRAASGNCNLYVDDLSFKEIGVASGWTDADQQLHIPQTALQSYNELAWFDGTSASDAFVALDTQIATTNNNWSLSFWVFQEDNGQAYSFPFGGTSIKNIVLKNNNTSKLYYKSNAGTTYHALSNDTIPYGEWVSIVITATADTSITAYVNGVAQTTNSDMSDTEIVVDQFMSGYSNTLYNILGTINEVSYYSDVLTATEVLDLFNDGKAKSALEASGSAGLVGYWRNNGLSEWKDLKGSNDGNTSAGVVETILIPQGVDSTRDAQGFIMNRQKSTSCLNLTNEAYVDSPTGGFVGTSDFSVSCWFKTTDSNAWLLMKGEQGGGGKRYALYIHGSNYLTAEIDDNSTFVTWNGSATVNDGDWHHAVVTFDRSGNGQIYLDGSTDGSATSISSSTGSLDPTNHRDFTVGVNSNDEVSGPYTGQVDGVLIYTKALSLTEVEKNYNATKGNHRN